MWSQSAIVLAVWSAKTAPAPEMAWVMGPWLAMFLIYTMVRMHSHQTPSSVNKSCHGVVRIAAHAFAISFAWRLGMHDLAWAASLHSLLFLAYGLSTEPQTAIAMALYATHVFAIPHFRVSDHVLIQAMLWPGAVNLVTDIVLAVI